MNLFKKGPEKERKISVKLLICVFLALEFDDWSRRSSETAKNFKFDAKKDAAPLELESEIVLKEHEKSPDIYSTHLYYLYALSAG